MNMYKKVLITLLVNLLLVGCTTPPKIEYVTVYKEKISIVEMDESFFSPCNIHTPPDINKYLLSDALTKEIILTDYSISLIEDIGKCNISKRTYKEWYNKQKTILEGTNNE